MHHFLFQSNFVCFVDCYDNCCCGRRRLRRISSSLVLEREDLRADRCCYVCRRVFIKRQHLCSSLLHSIFHIVVSLLHFCWTFSGFFRSFWFSVVYFWFLIVCLGSRISNPAYDLWTCVCLCFGFWFVSTVLEEKKNGKEKKKEE